MQNVSDILNKEREFFDPWTKKEFIITDRKESDFRYGDKDTYIFGITRDVTAQVVHDSFCAFVKAWANWLFNVVIKAITCKWREIEARPACFGAKQNVKKIEFNVMKPYCPISSYPVTRGKLDLEAFFSTIFKSIGWENKEKKMKDFSTEFHETMTAKGVYADTNRIARGYNCEFAKCFFEQVDGKKKATITLTMGDTYENPKKKVDVQFVLKG